MSGRVYGGDGQPERTKKTLNIPERYEILLVLTIGKLKESYIFEQVDPSPGSVRGWWDDHGVRHIPKRKLEDLIID